MENLKNDGNGGDEIKSKGGGKRFFASKRFIIGVFITLVLLWCVWTILGFLDGGTSDEKIAHQPQAKPAPHNSGTTKFFAPDQHGTDQTGTKHVATAKKQDQRHDIYAKPKAHSAAPQAHGKTAAESDDAQKHGVATHIEPQIFGRELPGVTFVTACIHPLDYELNERFWGWRPNDILNVTDNINNFQLGVLEVTRRTTVALAENISRTGSTAAYVPSLEFAMNWFMIKPSKYWFPSAESKYQEGLDELRNYIKMLKKGEAHFYRRVDNIVPLFKAYESILGSCDENLVKDLGEISTFKADDYFYYTKGVASAMATILEATAEDFNETIESVQGGDVLHHAIESLHHAAHMSPWIVMEGKPDGMTANHRANMAAPISHARFYLGVLNVALTGNI